MSAPQPIGRCLRNGRLAPQSARDASRGLVCANLSQRPNAANRCGCSRLPDATSTTLVGSGARSGETESEDVPDNLVVRLGTVTEDLNPGLVQNTASLSRTCSGRSS